MMYELDLFSIVYATGGLFAVSFLSLYLPSREWHLFHFERNTGRTVLELFGFRVLAR